MTGTAITHSAESFTQQGAWRHGLRYGVSASVGPLTRRSITGFARKTTPFTANERETLLQISQHMHEICDIALRAKA